jgi:cystine transport system ATP-binding protein
MTSLDAAKPALVVSGLSKTFGSNRVFSDISFEVAEGSVTVIIGPSGSGKTTILRSLNGLEVADGGQVKFDDFTVDFGELPKRKSARERSLVHLRSHTGMVFQSHNLFANLDVMSNVTLGPIFGHKRNKSEVEEEAIALLTGLGLIEKASSFPDQLSGGQQQRVGIARAMALKPRVLLFDEPTSALDPELVGEVLAAIRSLAQQGWTMVIVTHEMRFAEQVSDQVLFIDGGSIIERGYAEDVLRNPKHPRTREFLGATFGDYAV